MSKNTLLAHILLYKNKKNILFCQIYLEDSKKNITFAAENKIAQKYTDITTKKSYY